MQRAGSDIFKVFRVLWFPLSPNAVLLGAAAVAIFFAGTWLGSVVIGHPGAATSAAAGFVPATTTAVVELNWPGHKGEKMPPGAVPARVMTWLGGEIGEVLKDTELKKEDRDGRMKHLQSLPSRYRWLYAWQLVLFFGLWSTFGVAICRILALRIARDEYCPLTRAFSFAWTVKLTGLLFPVAVALPLLVLGLGVFGAGLLVSIPYIGWLIGPLMQLLVVFAGLLFLAIAITSLLSLGLVPAAIAIERKGTYDSLGKSINYVLARPIPVIFYGGLVWVFLGLLHGLLLKWSAAENLYDSFFPAFAEQANRIVLGQAEGESGFAWLMAQVHGLVWMLLRLVFYGLLVALGFGAFTSAFFILREDVDGLPPEDVAPDREVPPAPVEAAPAPKSEAAPAPAEAPAAEPAASTEAPKDAAPAESSEEPKKPEVAGDLAEPEPGPGGDDKPLA